jgi:two-component system, chemotaxis family, sensor kinase CheA
MVERRMTVKKGPAPSSQRLPLALGAGLLVFAAAVLWPGLQLAGRIDDSAAAIRLVSAEQRAPELIAGALGTVRDRLETAGYVDHALTDVRLQINEFDALLARLAGHDAGSEFSAHPALAIARAPELAAELAALRRSWSAFRHALDPVIAYQGLPYSDSESFGSRLNAGGQKLQRDVLTALGVAHRSTPDLVRISAGIAAALELESERLSSYLRMLLLVALAGTVLLAVAVVYFFAARRSASLRLAEAQQQTTDILRTVKEGLFLLDADSHIGAAHSASLARLFKAEHVAGLSFEDLLRPIVSEKTLATAMKFVDVLWSERTRENLVRSINPLQEVEISLDDGAGGRETRWLEFDFHRVRNQGRLTSLLVSVSDVSARVQLARELADSREKAQSQLDTMLGILHLDPLLVGSFLDDSDVTFKTINSILREPAREEPAFRRKLDGIFRQIHAVKGEASALGLGTVATRAHEFEDALKDLRERSALSGTDFLPLVVKLDDLFTHLASIRDLVTRLGHLQGPQDGAEAPERAPVAANVQPAAGAVGETLAQLVTRIAHDRGKRVEFSPRGLELVPADFRKPIKDIAVQLLRNAVVHGIEAPEERAREGKPAAGAIRLEFRDDGEGGYQLVVEDDGAGLSLDRIRESAVRRGFVTAEQAPGLEPRQLIALLMRPGFSTVDDADGDAGRGVGMNLVATLVKDLKGTIAIATGKGRFTRFTVGFPASAAQHGAAA